MQNKSRNRRRNYFIDKRFQRNFILKFCVLVVIGSIISGAIIYAMSMSTVTTTFENSRLKIKTTADYILPAVLLSSVIVIFLIGIAAIIITLFTSHKIAGPLYRIEQDIKEIESGNLQKKISLRHSDEIKRLAEGLNDMTQAIRTDMDEVKKDVREVETIIKSSDGVPLKANEKIKNIKSILAKFKT